MNSLLSLSVPIQNLLCFWAQLACLGSIANEFLLWRQHRHRAFFFSSVCAVLSFFIVHVCREGTQLRVHETTNGFAQMLLQWPFEVYVFCLLAVSTLCVISYRSVLLWGKTHVTSASIKESIDGLPAGVCYYLEDNRCILSNHRMKNICLALLKEPLQNGAALYEASKSKPVFVLPDGTAVSFRHRVIPFDGVFLHELIADDVTLAYQKNEQLRVDNERARRLQEGIKAYGETIADTVREEEILQAKVNIHDGMNRMILATKKAMQESATDDERKGILQMWQGQALMLCKEADTQKSNHVVTDLNTLAQVIGIKLRWDSIPQTSDSAVLSLFLSATREAMINATKHAHATFLRIDVEESKNALRATFTNDGRKAVSPIQETGGLLNLRERLKKSGGHMQIQTEPDFQLMIQIPEGENHYGNERFNC